ncbi:MAG: hypothetical protein ACSLFF_04795 [Solirubrobacterales bacterium]
MHTRTFLLALVASLSALALTAAFAGAAKAPTYHVYKKCSTKIDCTAAAYLNAKQTRAITVTVSKRCSDKSLLGISFSGSAKVSSKGKFTVETVSNNWDVTNQVTVKGNGKIKGKVKKKDKVTLEWSIDKAPAACPKSGTLTPKYKGTQTGG